MNKRRLERGSVNGSVFTIIALVILVLVFGSFGIWSYMNYMDQKTNTDQKVEEATAEAVLKASEKLQAEFEEKEKLKKILINSLFLVGF